MVLDRLGTPIGSVQDSKESIKISDTVGVLDLAEAISMTLIVDVTDVTFTICESIQNNNLKNINELPLVKTNEIEENDKIVDDVSVLLSASAATSSDRVSRSAYFGILDMDDKGMKSSYMIKEADVYQKQMDEDVELEEYWQRRLELLPKDSNNSN